MSMYTHTAVPNNEGMLQVQMYVCMHGYIPPQFVQRTRRMLQELGMYVWRHQLHVHMYVCMHVLLPGDISLHSLYNNNKQARCEELNAFAYVCVLFK
jgi:hypothetical protein